MGQVRHVWLVSCNAPLDTIDILTQVRRRPRGGTLALQLPPQRIAGQERCGVRRVEQRFSILESR